VLISAFFLKKCLGVLSVWLKNITILWFKSEKINAVNGLNYQEHALPHIIQLTVTSRLAWGCVH
jgi:hypothetical protein